MDISNQLADDYIYTIERNIYYLDYITNINKIIKIIQEQLYDYLNLLLKYNEVFKIMSQKNDVNDFYFKSEIEDVFSRIKDIPDTLDNKLYKKLAINICNYFIKELSKEDNNIIIVDQNNYMYFYLIFFVSGI